MYALRWACGVYAQDTWHERSYPIQQILVQAKMFE